MAVLQAGLDVRDRCRQGELTRHGLDSLRGRLEARLARLIDAPPPLKDAKRFAKHLANEFPAVFLFLRDPSIDATNWRAEQAIRPAVVIRKVCGGNRTCIPPHRGRRGHHADDADPWLEATAKTWSVKPPVSAYCSRTRRPVSFIRSPSRM